MESLVSLLTDPTAWAALATLTVMEVVLGIDNLIFISVVSNKLPEAKRSRARRIGIAGALFLRLGLLATVAAIVQLTEPVFEIASHGFSWKDLILIAGGLFLVWKATREIHHTVDPDPESSSGSITLRSDEKAVPPTMSSAPTTATTDGLRRRRSHARKSTRGMPRSCSRV